MSQSIRDFLDRLKQSITSYYTATYSIDTDLYAILQTYSAEFASGSQQIETAYNNVFLMSANTDKLYNNFGTYFDQAKDIRQSRNDDRYVTGSGSIPAYRKTVDFLMDAALHGGTLHAIKRTVNAFTLMNPDIRELYDVDRWRLKAFSGSVAQTSDNVITISPDPGWRRNEWVGAITTLYSGSSAVPPQQGGKIAIIYIVTGNTQNQLTLGPISQTLIP